MYLDCNFSFGNLYQFHLNQIKPKHCFKMLTNMKRVLNSYSIFKKNHVCSAYNKLWSYRDMRSDLFSLMSPWSLLLVIKCKNNTNLLFKYNGFTTMFNVTLNVWTTLTCPVGVYKHTVLPFEYSKLSFIVSALIGLLFKHQ